MGLRIGRSPIRDTEPTAWLLEGLFFGRTVGSWIPRTFERYARILHPAHAGKSAEDHRAVPWSEVSAWSGKPLHRASSIHDLARRGDGAIWPQRGELPFDGQLEPPQIDRLIAHLAAATGTPEAIWLLVWIGYGGLLTARNRDAVVDVSRSLTASARSYLLYGGSLDPSPHPPLSLIPEPPTFWWPADRSWFVSTDIDIASTYVGGSAALIERLLVDDLLEAWPADLDDPIDGARDEPDFRPFH